MSDARPITFVTEFVCGSCWNSFSRSEGMDSADGLYIHCPHCDHQNPLDPDAQDHGSATSVAVPSAGTSRAADAAEQPPAIDRSVAPRSRVTAPGAVVKAAAVSAPSARSARTSSPSRESASSSTRAVADRSPSPVHQGPASTSVGAVDMAAGARAEAAGHEDNVSPMEDAPAMQPISEDEIAAALADVASSVPAADPEQGAAVEPVARPGGLPAEESGETAQEPHEWKLKAPSGLTYNFHSLDAMMGWAATKPGGNMEVSINGEHWFDFGVFCEGVRGGLSGAQALEVLGAPGQTGEELRFVGMESGAIQVRGAMDDIAALDAREAAAQRLKATQPSYSGVGAVALVPAAAQVDGDGVNGPGGGRDPLPVSAPAGPVTRNATGRQPAIATTGDQRTRDSEPSTFSPPARAGSIAETKAAKPPAKAGMSGAFIAGAIVATIAIGVIALHFGGIISIPGLP